MKTRQKKLTAAEREAIADERKEDRRLMKSLNMSLKRMDCQMKTALVVYARELVSPGILYQATCGREAAKVLGL